MSSGPPNKRLKNTIESYMIFQRKTPSEGISHGTNGKPKVISSRTDNSFGCDVTISIDPKPDGNCQFSCLAHELARLGIGSWTPGQLRCEVTTFIETKCQQNTGEGVDIRQFTTGCDWRKYVEKMKIPGEFGDHLTLQACADKYQVPILVLSSLGTDHTQLIKPKSHIDEVPHVDPVAILGHYPEQGGHYVVLTPVAPKTVSNLLPQQNIGTSNSTEIATGECDRNDDMKDDSVHSGLTVTSRDNEYDSQLQPSFLSHAEFSRKKASYPWLLMERGKLGCEICRSVSTLEVYKTQGVRLASEWTQIAVSEYGHERKQKLRSLRKKLCEHSNSAAHKAATMISMTASKKAIHQSVTKLNNINQATTQRVFRTAYSIAKRGRPFLDMASYIELQTVNGLDMGRTLHSNMSCASIVDHISDEMRKKLVAHIIEKRCKISILIDESTTFSRKTTLIVYLRAAIGDKPQTFFFDLVELSSTKTEDIYGALIQCLKSHGLTIDILTSILICVATDGASVMLGKKSGVCHRLLQEFPHLVIWHCSNHRLELSVHDTVEEVAGINQFHIFFDKLYALYHQSPKAQRELEEACKEVNARCLTIGRILNTRWVASSLRTVVAVWKQYEALSSHFMKASTDSTRTTREKAQYSGLQKKLSTTAFVLNIGILRDALEELADVSLQLQKEDMTLPRAHGLVSRQVRVFRSMVDKPGMYATETQEAVKAMTFHNVHLKSGSAADVLINHKQFFASLATNFESRMLTTRASGSHDKTTDFHNAEYKSLLDALRCLDPSTWPDELDVTYGDDNIAKLSERFLLSQRDCIQGFREYKDNGGKIAPESLLPLTLSVNTLVVSTAACERGFSHMNVLLGPTRSSLSVARLSKLMFLKLNGPPLAQFKPEKYVTSWLVKHVTASDSRARSCCYDETEHDSTVQSLWSVL